MSVSIELPRWQRTAVTHAAKIVAVEVPRVTVEVGEHRANFVASPEWWERESPAVGKYLVYIPGSNGERAFCMEARDFEAAHTPA